MNSTRRDFLKDSTALAIVGSMVDWASAAAQKDKLGELLPLRTLTRDGTKVTAFCLGGSHFGATEDPSEAERMIERSMELGIRFFDNARGYHKGRAEEYMGRFLTPKYREHIFLMTKAPQNTADGVRQQLDDSLKALKTDYLDLWQMHSLRDTEDVDKRINNGVLDFFLEAKEKGKTRYIGFTGHINPKVHLYFLDALEKRGIKLDTSQMPLNVCDPSFESFEKQVLPVLLEKEYGVIAMKTMAGGGLLGGRISRKEDKVDGVPDVVAETELTKANLHQYVYALPVATLCSGCETPKEIEENVAVLRNLKHLSQADRDKLVALAKPYAGNVVESYKKLLG